MEVHDLGEFAAKNWPAPEKGFAKMIQNIDRDTGRIIDLVRELKIADNTLVIFTWITARIRKAGIWPITLIRTANCAA